VGRQMFADGLISSFDGNMSIRRGERIVITRRSAMLHGLEETDLIEMPMDAAAHPPGSNEFIVHNAIYRTTTALAVIYAHPPTALALSLSPGSHEIVSWEPESALLARNVPILDVEKVLGPKEFANVICRALSGVGRQNSIRICGSLALSRPCAVSSTERRSRNDGCRPCA